MKLNWEKSNGLIPAIIQNPETMQVLMLGYMDEKALEKTLETRQVTFFSRTKQSLWTKGETSGNHLNLIDLQVDCDQDTLLVYAKPSGPCCHLNTNSCFAKDILKSDVIATLENVIEKRQQERPVDSYVAKLFSDGPLRMAQKIGEEGVEVALAAAIADSQKIISESADLIFHVLVLLKQFKIKWTDVLHELKRRMS